MGIGVVAVSIASLSKFAADLRRLPRSVAIRVAEHSAPAITTLARATFSASANAYGVPWAPGVDGDRVTMNQTGNLARRIHYVAIGTKLRVALGVPYAKYQIGKRPVFPSQGGALPAEYARTLAQVAVNVVRSEMSR